MMLFGPGNAAWDACITPDHRTVIARYNDRLLFWRGAQDHEAPKYRRDLKRPADADDPKLASLPAPPLPEGILKQSGRIAGLTPTGSKSFSGPGKPPEEPFLLTSFAVNGHKLEPNTLQSIPENLHCDTVSLTGTGLKDASLAHLRRMDFRSLDLSYTPIGDAGVEKILTGRPDLVSLQLNGGPATEASAAHLRTLPRLRYLYFGVRRLTDTGWQEIAGFPSLRHLGVPANIVHGRQLAPLEKAPYLQSLELGQAILRDDAVAALGRLGQLRVLRIPRVKLAAEALRKLEADNPRLAIEHPLAAPSKGDRHAIAWALKHQARIHGWDGKKWGDIAALPAGPFLVESLTLENRPPGGEFVNLRGLRGIGNLNVGGLRDGDAAAEHIATLDSLHILQLWGSDLTEAGLKQLTALKQLEYLVLHSNPKLTDGAMVHLAALPHLNRLRMRHARIGDAGLAHLAKVAGLQHLELADCRNLTAAGLKHLQALPILRELDLSNTNLGDEAAEGLKGAASLRVVRLQGTRVTWRGVNALHQALPHCAIVWDGGLVVPGASPLEPPPPVPLPDLGKDPERTLAQWVLSKPNAVVYVKAGGAERAIPRADHLPKEPFQVVRVLFWPGYRVTDADLPWLHRCATLVQFGAHDAQVTDEGLARLATYPCASGLGELTLHSRRLTDGGVAHLTKFPSLRRLSLSGSAIGPAGADVLAKLPNLQALGLHGTMVSDAWLAKWKHLKLESLDVSFSPDITDEGMKSIAIMKTIRSLWIKETDVGDAGIAALAGWTQLHTLQAGDCRLTAKSLPVIAGMTNLGVLNLGGAALGDEDLVHLKPLQKLHSLYLWNDRLTDRGLEHLAVFPKLSSLYLSGYKNLTEKGLKALAEIKTLKHVNLGNARVTAAGVAELRKALPGCTVQWSGK